MRPGASCSGVVGQEWELLDEFGVEVGPAGLEPQGGALLEAGAVDDEGGRDRARNHGGLIRRDDGTTAYEPIWNWSTGDVWEYLHAHEIPINPISDNCAGSRSQALLYRQLHKPGTLQSMASFPLEGWALAAWIVSRRQPGSRGVNRRNTRNRPVGCCRSRRIRCGIPACSQAR